MISKCECLHCKGGIEFESSDFQEESRTTQLIFGQNVNCPHCGKLTSIYLDIKPVKNLPPQFLLSIGDIGITPDQVITPNGSGPLAGSQWIFTDTSRTETKIPAVAIILAIVFALLCLIGLLFLLMKERTTTGYVEVTVHSGNLFHKTQIPVNSQAKIDEIRKMVSKAQMLAMQAT